MIDNAPVDAGDFHPIPSENPPVVNAYGRGTVHMMTNPNSTQLIPNEIGSHFKKTNVSQALELFKIEISYDANTNPTEFYRLAGTELINPISVICGAFFNVQPGGEITLIHDDFIDQPVTCLLYTSPSPRDKRQSRMPSSA